MATAPEPVDDLEKLWGDDPLQCEIRNGCRQAAIWSLVLTCSCKSLSYFSCQDCKDAWTKGKVTMTCRHCLTLATEKWIEL